MEDYVVNSDTKYQHIQQKYKGIFYPSVAGNYDLSPLY